MVSVVALTVRTGEKIELADVVMTNNAINAIGMKPGRAQSLIKDEANTAFRTLEIFAPKRA